MRKRISIAGIAVGALMVIMSFLIPSLMVAAGPRTGSVGIIGGAGVPTARLFYNQYTAWLTWLGALVAAAGILGLTLGRKTGK